MNLKETKLHISQIKEKLFIAEYALAYDIMLENGDNYAHFGINGLLLYTSNEQKKLLQ